MRDGLSLTGIPLIALAILGTAATLAATVLTWVRWRRWRVPRRTAGVLLTEALLLLSVGLVVNRSEQFYPSWSALVQTASAGGTSYAVAPGHLDGSLRADGGAPFTWQPTGWTRWRLAAAPSVVVPAGYLRHTNWRYSAVLVLDGGTPAPSALAAITVFVRTTKATTARTLATDLPAALSHDLRATGHRWALVAPAADARLARLTVVAAPARFPAVAFVRGGAPPFAAGIAVDRAATTVAAALTWAGEQLPPPLAASTPAATYVAPVHRHSHHPKPGGSRVPRQPRR